MDQPLFPDVHVPLVGEDSNAYSIMGRVQRIAKRAGVPKESIDAYMQEAMSGDYNHLLRTTMKYFDTSTDEE